MKLKADTGSVPGVCVGGRVLSGIISHCRVASNNVA